MSGQVAVPRKPVAAIARSAALRLVAFGFLWWVLNLGQPTGWVFSVLAILSATAASMAVLPIGARRPSVVGMVRFVAFFLAESWRGGMDVARRALHPRLPLEPDIVDFGLRLPPGAARIFFANIVSLLPGTLTAELLSDRLRVHVLDGAAPDLEQKLRLAETRVASAFGVALPAFPERDA